jgi:uncharacterized protein
MNVFFDTSALAKYFIVEAGTERVTSLVQDPSNTCWVFELARVEFISAVYRRYRSGELTEQRLNVVVEGFNTVLSSQFEIEPFARPILVEAEQLMRTFANRAGLRTLDALHLAAFRLVAQADWSFAVADKNLAEIVESMGFSSIVP